MRETEDRKTNPASGIDFHKFCFGYLVLQSITQTIPLSTNGRHSALLAMANPFVVYEPSSSPNAVEACCPSFLTKDHNGVNAYMYPCLPMLANKHGSWCGRTHATSPMI